MSFEQLRHEVRLCIVHTDIVHGKDVRMIQRRGRTRLLFEPAHQGRVVPHVDAHDLDRHVAAEPRVTGGVNHPPPPPPPPSDVLGTAGGGAGTALSDAQQLAREIRWWTVHEILIRPLPCEEQPDLVPHRDVGSASLVEKCVPVLGSALECGVKQLLERVPAVFVHSDTVRAAGPIVRRSQAFVNVQSRITGDRR